MKRESAIAIVGWLQHSLVDVNKICDYFGVPYKKRDAIREMAQNIRAEKYGA